MGTGMSPLSDAKSASLLPASLTDDLPPLEMTPADMSLSFSVAEKHIVADLNEMVHDPELDEAVIAFANADYDTSERILIELTRAGGPRNFHGETAGGLFDHHRATGAQAKFEALAIEYAQQFGLSAPQWFSMAQAGGGSRAQRARADGQFGRRQLDGAGVPAGRIGQAVAGPLRKPAHALGTGLAPLRQLDTEACEALRQLFRQWAEQQIDMRWLAGDRFLQLLKDLAPVAVRDVDPALWMLRLEALRLVNRPDQFDETAIDYCVTYEVSRRPGSARSAACASAARVCPPAAARRTAPCP